VLTDAADDCLTLNIWAPPPKPDGELMPVMIWIPGRDLVFGGSSVLYTNGARFAAQPDIVVVDKAGCGGRRNKDAEMVCTRGVNATDLMDAYIVAATQSIVFGAMADDETELDALSEEIIWCSSATSSRNRRAVGIRPGTFSTRASDPTSTRDVDTPEEARLSRYIDDAWAAFTV
jgi:hypothetical protein